MIARGNDNWVKGNENVLRGNARGNERILKEMLEGIIKWITISLRRFELVLK